MRSGFPESVVLVIKVPGDGSRDWVSMILCVYRKVQVRTSNGQSLSSWTCWIGWLQTNKLSVNK